MQRSQIHLGQIVGGIPRFLQTGSNAGLTDKLMHIGKVIFISDKADWVIVQFPYYRQGMYMSDLHTLEDLLAGTISASDVDSYVSGVLS